MRALVLVSHDRRFLANLSRLTAVARSRQYCGVSTVGFAQFEAWRDEQLALEEVERHKLDRRIAREEDWLRYGVTARRKRNVRRWRELQHLRQQRRRDFADRLARRPWRAGNAGRPVRS